MARHNRDARGTDQRGHDYEVSYQPDWVRLIKVTRSLESGRQSTKTLFKNQAPREQSPGTKVRTRIVCRDQPLEFAVELDDPNGIVARIIVVTEPSAAGGGETLEFTIDGRRVPGEPEAEE